MPQSQVINAPALRRWQRHPSQGKDRPYRRYQARRLGSPAAGGSLTRRRPPWRSKCSTKNNGKVDRSGISRSGQNSLRRSVPRRRRQQTFSAYSNLATSLSIKAPVNPNEQMANAYAADVQTIRQLDPIAGNIATIWCQVYRQNTPLPVSILINQRAYPNTALQCVCQTC